jgi:hypothetical protein
MAGFSYANGSCFCARKECSKECNTYAKYGPKQKTNAERIRSMNDEEFSHFLFGIQCAPASRPKEWLNWLKQEAE